MTRCLACRHCPLATCRTSPTATWIGIAGRMPRCSSAAGERSGTLYDRVMAAGSPPIVLFYGQSGVGKSSLLAAGLLPRLEGSHAVRYARRDQAAGLLGTLAAALGRGA